jgi:hypothetical protein
MRRGHRGGLVVPHKQRHARLVAVLISANTPSRLPIAQISGWTSAEIEMLPTSRH